MSLILMAGLGLAGFLMFTVLVALMFRVVVPTNAVHIVQSGKRTTSYGSGMGSNTYYSWPAWIPMFGVRTSALPLSVFRVELENYAAYDKGRLPFMLDVLAFFRISDPNKAAERISSINELDGQLQGIMQGVVRTILANAEIEEILGKRAEFSEAFTKEVKEQLPQWGIETVKNIELMDIRDSGDSKVIANIMAKKKSSIEMESRTAVAVNMRQAQIAEVEAGRQVGLAKQEAEEVIGKRTAEKDQAVGIASQKSMQAVASEEAVTTTAKMAVAQIEKTRTAEIEKGVQVVRANQEKEVAVVKAEGNKQQLVINAEGEATSAAKVAEGNMNAKKYEAEGVRALGEATGAAETAKLMAPVTAQLTLAEKIGANESYQRYLIDIRTVESVQAVGVEQAKALSGAEIKIVATAGTPGEGMSSVRDLFSAKGGAIIGAALAAFKATNDDGKTIEGTTTKK